MSVLDSLDSIIASINTNGAYRRFYGYGETLGGGTTPTATAGGLTYLRRVLRTITVPTMSASALGMYLIRAKIHHQSTSNLGGPGMLGIEYKLGSINMATGAFTDGVAMPTKRHSGLATAVQSSAQLVVLAMDTAGSFTTPTITVTYTDQDGNTGNSAALVLPSNPIIGSAYDLRSVFAAGDTGVQDVTNITRSAGTSGTVSVYGYLFLAAGMSGGPGSAPMIEPMSFTHPLWLCEPGDLLGFIIDGSQVTYNLLADLLGVMET